MVPGRGHSLWAVPYNYAEIAAKYNMKHIPHVSLEHGLAKPSNSHTLFNRVTLKFENKLCRIKDRTLELDCAGIYCDLKHIDFKDQFYFMPVWFDYEGKYDVIDEFPGKYVQAQIFRANTESEDPSEWFIS